MHQQRVTSVTIHINLQVQVINTQTSPSIKVSHFIERKELDDLVRGLNLDKSFGQIIWTNHQRSLALGCKNGYF